MAALRYLNGSVLQGGADAFAINTIVTALSGATRQAYRVRTLEFEVPLVIFNADLANVELCLLRRTKAAMPLITDPDVIKKVKWLTRFTTSGAHNASPVLSFQFEEDADVLVVEDPLYLAIDSNATSSTQTGYVRIGYELTTISEVDRLTLLTQSLV